MIIMGKKPDQPRPQHTCRKSHSTKSTRYLGDGRMETVTMWWCLCGKQVN